MLAERFIRLDVDDRRRFVARLRANELSFAELPIVPVSRAAAPLLSHAQSRQWFLWRLDEQNTAYHIAAGLRLGGVLSVEALSSALTALWNRHESLRTVFRVSRDGSGEQVIQPPGPLKIEMIDLSNAPAEAREALAAERARSMARTPFDLRTGPLFRVGQVRLSAEDHVLVVSMHHIVSDGWSTQVIVKEFAELYRASLERREARLEPLPIQYADYAMWQRNWLEAGEQERQLHYWKAVLGSRQPILQLPADHPRATEPNYRAAHHAFELPERLIQALHERAKEYRTTLFTVLLAGFQVLLHRYTDRTDIRVGMANANRNRLETQGVVGFFVNTQVLRTEIESGASLGAVLDRARAAVVGAQEHQDLPLEQLVEALHPERSLSYPPLFQVMMNHQRRDAPILPQLPGLTVQTYELGEQQAQFDLTLSTTEHRGGRVDAAFTYAEQLFDAPTIARLGQHYMRVLSALSASVDRTVGSIDLDDAVQSGLRRASPHALAPVDRRRPLLLSCAQQRRLLAWKMDSGNTACNTARAVHILGALDESRLRSCLEDVIDRQQLLRTTFHFGECGACQVIGVRCMTMRTEDLTSTATPDRQARARRIAEEDASRPFDLDTGPAFRVTLLKLDESEHILLVTLHRIVADERSQHIFFDELFAFYDARHPEVAPTLPVQYADYAVWEQKWLGSAAAERQLSYWKSQLGGAVSQSVLPANGPRPPARSFEGDAHRSVIDPVLDQRLRALAAEQGVDLLCVLLVAFAVVWRCRSGLSAFFIGTDVENRPRPELQPLVGPFVNELALQVRFEGLQTAAQLLARTDAILRQALEHQDVPMERLVELLRERNRFGRAPFFSVKLNYRSDMDFAPSLLSASEFPIDRQAIDLDAIVTFVRTNHTLAMIIRYSTDLFDAASAACLSAQMHAVLLAFCESGPLDLDRLEETAAQVRQAEIVALKSRRQALTQAITPARRRGIASTAALAEFTPLREDGPLPMKCVPVVSGLSLSAWAREHRGEIESILEQHGAILFRGFDVRGAAEFNTCIDAMFDEAIEYRLRSSPRTQVDAALRVYTSTDYPPPEKIFPHNESSYAAEFPLKLFFYCDTPAASRGETPIGDTRQVLKRIDAGVRESFQRRKVMYVRNFGDGLGLAWQDVFQTTSVEEVERCCVAAGIAVEWRSGGRLRTRSIGPAIVRHPRTGELSWFNHATFFNALTLPDSIRSGLLSAYAPDELPQNTFYGDGAPIEPEVIAHLQQAYREAMIEFPWQSGDVLLLDNLVTAHARNEFTGTRRILVGMAGVGRAQELQYSERGDE